MIKGYEGGTGFSSDGWREIRRLTDAEEDASRIRSCCRTTTTTSATSTDNQNSINSVLIFENDVGTSYR